MIQIIWMFVLRMCDFISHYCSALEWIINMFQLTIEKWFSNMEMIPLPLITTGLLPVLCGFFFFSFLPAINACLCLCFLKLLLGDVIAVNPIPPSFSSFVLNLKFKIIQWLSQEFIEGSNKIKIIYIKYLYFIFI